MIDGAGQPYFAHRDGFGNVIAFTDRHEDLEKEYSAYPLWGGPAYATSLSSCSSEDCNRARYKGAMLAGEEAGLYYMRNRWYEPHTGRFLSEDPIGLMGGINKYAFVGNDPVNLTDPLGLCGPFTPLCMVLGRQMLSGAAKGIAMDLAFQAVFREEFSLGSTIVAGVTGALTGGLWSTSMKAARTASLAKIGSERAIDAARLSSLEAATLAGIDWTVGGITNGAAMAGYWASSGVGGSGGGSSDWHGGGEYSGSFGYGPYSNSYGNGYGNGGWYSSSVVIVSRGFACVTVGKGWDAVRTCTPKY